MQIYKIKESGKNLANVLLTANVGWSHEPIGMRGISHFLEHALFLGNEEHPNPDEEVAKYGVILNGETLADRTIFYFTSLPGDASEILDVLISLIFHPSFPENKVREEKESKIIPAVVRESDYYPWELAYEWARNLIFQWDFRYSMGTEEELNSLGIENLREWHRKYYHSGNTVLLIDGPVDISGIKIPDGGELPERQRVEWKEREFVVDRGIDNPEIVFAFPIQRYDLRAHLLSVILGNYPTSLFWKSFHRDAYMVDSRMEWHWRGGFFFYVGANDEPERIRKKFEKFLDGLKITKEDLGIAKKILSIEILEKERSPYKMEHLLKIDPQLKYGGFAGILDAISQIELNEVKEYASEIFDLSGLREVVVK